MSKLSAYDIMYVYIAVKRLIVALQLYVYSQLWQIKSVLIDHLTATEYCNTLYGTWTCNEITKLAKSIHGILHLQLSWSVNPFTAIWTYISSYANSLDHSASHPDPSCLTLSQYFVPKIKWICEVLKWISGTISCRTIASHSEGVKSRFKSSHVGYEY